MSVEGMNVSPLSRRENCAAVNRKDGERFITERLPRGVSRDAGALSLKT